MVIGLLLDAGEVSLGSEIDGCVEVEASEGVDPLDDACCKRLLSIELNKLGLGAPENLLSPVERFDMGWEAVTMTSRDCFLELLRFRLRPELLTLTEDWTEVEDALDSRGGGAGICIEGGSGSTCFTRASIQLSRSTSDSAHRT
jgi:hypothetical protein